MRSKLVGSAVLAAAILAVVFLLEPWRKEESSDQFVVHRREKRDSSSLESTENSSVNGTLPCTNGTNCSHTAEANFTLEEASKLCHQNTTNSMTFNCSGNVLSFSNYCAKIEEVSKNSSIIMDCIKLTGKEQYGSANATTNSSLSSSSVVVQLLVSPSKVLSVSLETSTKPAESMSSIILEVLPNKTVAVLQKETLSKNTSLGLSATDNRIIPSSTVHVSLPVSSSVEVKVVPTTEKIVSQITTQESTTVQAETTLPTTEITKPSTQPAGGPVTHLADTKAHKETTVKTTIHIIKNTVKSPYEEEEQNMRFFMSNVMVPISCGVGAAVLIALAFFMYRRCKRRKMKRVRYFGNRPGEKQFLDRMKLLEDSSEEE